MAKTIGNGTVYANNWSGKNNKPARSQAATNLYNDVISKRYSVMGTSITTDPVVLIGHSHGGNVAIMAFNMLTRRFQSDVKKGVLSEVPTMTLVTVNTPVRPDYQLDKQAEASVDHINVFTNGDLVQENGGDAKHLGVAGRTFKSAINIEYKDQIPLIDQSGCGISRHCGTAAENAMIWTPQVQSQVEVDRELKNILQTN